MPPTRFEKGIGVTMTHIYLPQRSNEVIEEEDARKRKLMREGVTPPERGVIKFYPLLQEIGCHHTL